MKAYQDNLIQEKKLLEYAVEQDAHDIQLSHIETIHTLIIASEFRDDETGKHVGRIGHYAKTLAGLLPQLPEEFAEALFYASALHDIGKLAIPDSILQKSGPLTDEEFSLIKQHTLMGERILSNASISPYLKLGTEVAGGHHECWDGSGYPRGLSGTDIPLGGRIVAICDVYDALRSCRPYKPAFDHDKAIAIMRHGDGRTRPEQFDPNLLRLFLANDALFADIFQQGLSITARDRGERLV